MKTQCAGRWIGVKDDQVVATSDSHRGIYEQLRAKQVSGVYVLYSPTEEEKGRGSLFGATLWT